MPEKVEEMMAKFIKNGSIITEVGQLQTLSIKIFSLLCHSAR
ncbi:MAG: hypothetical protein O4861_12930 [Trichodesmium sp. St16_bin4-tuft]|nr:hypothetical protein [Trichodesmium sp. St5_bin8]MDE5099185.1 hypothetical protein [Trichodesmium sp. St16_bin4-tuft]MDE5104601.1 hypothetical protein [Trichodesmium sp. St19_bin2]MDT9338015.1 hypothetical protein [Trichodesmium erythraeum 21-75]